MPVSYRILGVYISSSKIDKTGVNVVKYMVQQFSEKYVNSPLKKPIIMLFDPELNKNRLDIKVLNIHSMYFEDCPLFSEMQFKFNMNNFS
jgi:hypothetical protein